MTLISQVTPSPAMFFGRWHVRRVVIDQNGMGQALFIGEAVIDSERFAEQGETLVNGFRASSTRGYLLHVEDSCVTAQFPDGRAFIRIDGRASQRVRHDCGDDVYQGRFFFRSHNAWAETWHVTGPRKNYRSIARYVRV